MARTTAPTTLRGLAEAESSLPLPEAPGRGVLRRSAAGRGRSIVEFRTDG